MSFSDEILRRLAAGERPVDIAAALGLTESAVSHLRRRRGLATARPAAGPRLPGLTPGPAPAAGDPRAWSAKPVEERLRILERLGFDTRESRRILADEAGA